MTGVLVDTSAWIEFLRGTGSSADRQLAARFDRSEPVTVTGLVVQEVLQGARDERNAAELQKLLLSCQAVEPVYPETFEHAAALFRRCRQGGRTVRGSVDCLIAAVAIEHGLSLLASDRDFEPLRRVGGLSLL